MTEGAIYSWDLLQADEYVRSRAVFDARPDFAELVAEADRRGYRRITLAEQQHNLLRPCDVYNWRGGVWVKKESDTA
jgi:hypothetical protein